MRPAARPPRRPRGARRCRPAGRARAPRPPPRRRRPSRRGPPRRRARGPAETPAAFASKAASTRWRRARVMATYASRRVSATWASRPLGRTSGSRASGMSNAAPVRPREARAHHPDDEDRVELQALRLVDCRTRRPMRAETSERRAGRPSVGFSGLRGLACGTSVPVVTFEPAGSRCPNHAVHAPLSVMRPKFGSRSAAL